MIDETFEFRKLNGDEVFVVFRVLKAIGIKPYIESKLKETNELKLGKKETIEYITKDIVFYLIDNINLAETEIKGLICSYVNITDIKLLDIDEIYLTMQNMFKLGLGNSITSFFKNSNFLPSQNV